MAMGWETGAEGDLMLSWSELPRSPGHAFYYWLQGLLEAGFGATSGKPGFSGCSGTPKSKKTRSRPEELTMANNRSTPDCLNPTVTVLIPIYNGEKYIERTLQSALKQTFDAFEVICVDDCSTDNSLSITKLYSGLDMRVRVFSTSVNLGHVSKVIEFALPFMKGDYWIYSSQDDLFSEDWLEKLVRRAITTGADAVIPDVVFYTEKEDTNQRLIGLRGNREAQLSNREAVTLSLDWTIPGNALWNINIIKKVGVKTFGAFADEYSVRMWFLACNKVVFCDGVFYYRQDNPDAITKKISYKTFDRAMNHFMLYKLLKENNFPSKTYRSELHTSVNWIYFSKIYLRSTECLFSSQDSKQAELRVAQCLGALQKETFLHESVGSWKFFSKLLIIKLGKRVFSFVFMTSIYLRPWGRVLKHPLIFFRNIFATAGANCD